MANVIAPHGFQPIKGMGVYTGQINTYYIPATDTNQYGIGDAVMSTVGSDSTNGFPAVTKSTGVAGEYQLGVIVSVLPVQALGVPSLIGVPLTLENINIPATKTRGYYVAVSDDPQQLYQIQDDGLNALTATATNKNAAFTPTNPPAPLQISATVLNSGSVATTANLPLKMMGLYQQYAPAGGNTLGANAIWVVKFNLHVYCANGIAGN
jgi:hypothetical protein